MNYKKGISRIVDLICLIVVLRFLVAMIIGMVQSYSQGVNIFAVLGTFICFSLSPIVSIFILQILKPRFTKAVVWVVDGFKDNS